MQDDEAFLSDDFATPIIGANENHDSDSNPSKTDKNGAISQTTELTSENNTSMHMDMIKEALGPTTSRFTLRDPPKAGTPSMVIFIHCSSRLT